MCRKDPYRGENISLKKKIYSIQIKSLFLSELENEKKYTFKFWYLITFEQSQSWEICDTRSLWILLARDMPDFKQNACLKLPCCGGIRIWEICLNYYQFRPDSLTLNLIPQIPYISFQAIGGERIAKGHLTGKCEINSKQDTSSPAAKTHFGGEPGFVRYSFFYDWL